MNQPIRVLLADDSALVRRIISQVVNSHPSCDIVFAAADGREAIEKYLTLQPDLVILDLKMPKMDGIEVLTQIRKHDRTIPVIICSTLTTPGAEATMEALTAGASDYITKPTQVGHIQDAIRHLQQELLPKVLIWGSRRHVRTTSDARIHATAPSVASTEARQLEMARLAVIGIGVSTGGPNALAEVLAALPASFPTPILIAQHMPPMFTRLLAERLSQQCRLPVSEAEQNMPIESGKVLIAPGDHHLTVLRHGTQDVCRLNKNPPINSCRPSVDVLFNSLAEVYGKHCLAVVLTGMGRDGLDGCHNVHNVGGKIIVQDEESSTVWGMPRVVAEAKLADLQLPLRKIGPELTRLAAGQRPALAASTAI